MSLFQVTQRTPRAPERSATAYVGTAALGRPAERARQLFVPPGHKLCKLFGGEGARATPPVMRSLLWPRLRRHQARYPVIDHQLPVMLARVLNQSVCQIRQLQRVV